MSKPIAYPFAFLIGLACLFTSAIAQLPPDEALARLKARQHSAAATRPTTQPATTRPASLKDAHRIVLLLDSRLVPVKLPDLREELTLAIDHLREDQLFTIIVAKAANQVPAEFRASPVRATNAVKAEAADFLRALETDYNAATIPAIRNPSPSNPTS